MRANGEVRFVRISARLQRRVAWALAALLAIWASVTLVMLVSSFNITAERLALQQRQQSVQSAAERVSAYRESVGDVAKDLTARQELLESLCAEHFGAECATKPDAAAAEAEAAAKKISAAVPEAGLLARIEARQLAYAGTMTRIAERRTALAETAIRSFGLNPDTLARSQARGGPFIPFFGKGKKVKAGDPRFGTLADALERMSTMERLLGAIPSTNPATVPALTSSFGYRRDPFTGAAAMHAGLDFAGPFGSPILSAANGTVSFVGQKSGYGNVVEVSHGGGIVTRYAHLSGFGVKMGQKVARGSQIARMGSTGRSTGTHLHFEVRVNDVAMNPAKFLENGHVLEKPSR